MVEIHQLLECVIAQHSETRIINLSRSLAAASCFDKNASAIVNFTVDIILNRIDGNLTTALLMRTDHPDDPREGRQFLSRSVALLMAEFHRRGVIDVTFLPPGADLPDVPDPRCIPIVTYGMAGLNIFERYEALIAMHAYHIAPEAIANSAFDYLPPSKRPRLKFVKGDLRRLDWSHLPGVTAEMRQTAEAMFVRLEIDATLQAAARVRFTIRPRLLILNARFNLAPYVGRVTSVQNLSHARIVLGLHADTRQPRREQQARALRTHLEGGGTLSSAAKSLGISRRTATSLHAEFGGSWQVLKGRPLGRAP